MRPIQIPEQSEEQLKALEELYRTTRNVRASCMAHRFASGRERLSSRQADEKLS